MEIPESAKHSRQAGHLPLDDATPFSAKGPEAGLIDAYGKSSCIVDDQ